MNKLINYILLIGLNLTINGCSEQKNINDIWIGNFPERTSFQIKEKHILTSPKILDLTDKKTAIVKFFNETPKEISWDLDGDILTLNSVPYRIISLTEDSLIFSSSLTPNEEPVEEFGVTYISDGDTVVLLEQIGRNELYTLSRIKKTKFNQTQKEISKIIENKIWRNEEVITDSLYYIDWIEFLDNGVALYKIDVRNKIENIQNECWEIEKYKDYVFLLFYRDQFRKNGNWDYAYQIISLNEEEIILDTYNKKNNIFISKTAKQNFAETFKTKFKGKWFSVNDTNRCYGNTPDYSIKNGNIIRYSDTLTFEFCKDSLFVNIKNIETSKLKWKLNANNSILITEEKLEFDSIVSFHTDYFLIKDITEKSFDLKMFDNYRETGICKPNQIVLNKLQKFKKIN